ncbi:hypothetical protein A2326_02365 [candidate division WWE3 bacterium RIFOXYB2_FULL_41_6]|nr:MAG: hypothetical protein A2326_02365 [candidate division WWE3 bacterium RIFOXYB2_FULL_41_6]HLD50910.1 hypothetical protein [Patescibacteria group bacterium]
MPVSEMTEKNTVLLVQERDRQGRRDGLPTLFHSPESLEVGKIAQAFFDGVLMPGTQFKPPQSTYIREYDHADVFEPGQVEECVSSGGADFVEIPSKYYVVVLNVKPLSVAPANPDLGRGKPVR